MRNWKPYIADVVRQMREDDITSVVAICLAPQNSRTSVGLYRRAVFAAADGGYGDRLHRGLGRPSWSSPRPSPSDCGRCGKVFRRVSVGGRRCCLPRTVCLADPSRAPSLTPIQWKPKRTAANVATLLAPLGLTAADWFFAFQSQGMSGASWIGPTVEDTLTALRQEGHSAVVIQPIGFLCDHVEILYDIDIGFRNFAAGIGLEVVRPQSLNDSALLTATLVDLAQQGFARLAPRSLATPIAAL